MALRTQHSLNPVFLKLFVVKDRFLNFQSIIDQYFCKKKKKVNKNVIPKK